jgi:hypothetical protein
VLEGSFLSLPQNIIFFAIIDIQTRILPAKHCFEVILATSLSVGKYYNRKKLYICWKEVKDREKNDNR